MGLGIHDVFRADNVPGIDGNVDRLSLHVVFVIGAYGGDGVHGFVVVAKFENARQLLMIVRKNVLDLVGSRCAGQLLSRLLLAVLLGKSTLVDALYVPLQVVSSSETFAAGL